MYQTQNPFRSLLTATGAIDRAAVMRAAWARFKANPRRYCFLARSRSQAFGRALQEAWANARQGQANEVRRAREAREEAALQAERIARQNTPSTYVFTGWSESDLIALSTDGRIHPRRLAA